MMQPKYAKWKTARAEQNQLKAATGSRREVFACLVQGVGHGLAPTHASRAMDSLWRMLYSAYVYSPSDIRTAAMGRFTPCSRELIVYVISTAVKLPYSRLVRNTSVKILYHINSTYKKTVSKLTVKWLICSVRNPEPFKSGCLVFFFKMYCAFPLLTCRITKNFIHSKL